MKPEVHAPACGRENELIAFLYGELDAAESTVFRSHMQNCLSCSAEMTEFTGIRESVVAWRNDALAGVTSPSVQATVVRPDTAKPTALMALREFFNLSPLWMKGAVVFASLLFCLLAVLSASHLRETPSPKVAADANAKQYSQQELEALVERRVQDEMQRIKSPAGTAATTSSVATGAPHRDSVKRTSNRGNEIAANVPQQKARRPLSKVERLQLAADLRLIDNPNDVDLDLLDDRINQ